MSDSNGIHQSLARIEEKVNSIDHRVDSVEKNMELIRSFYIDLNKTCAVLTSDGHRREKRISSLEHTLRVVENTGQTYIVKAQATWKVVVIAATASVGLITTMEVLFRLWRK